LNIVLTFVIVVYIAQIGFICGLSYLKEIQYLSISIRLVVGSYH